MAEAAVSDLTLDELGDRLSVLAARIAAGECEFLVLLAEFDRRQGWGASGMKSTAHWLSWRTGLRLGVAREKVRVARALARLPLVRDAFAAGRLSYCKVRALSRVATAPTEAQLLELALGATGGQLERIVRAWRKTLLPEQAASRHLRRGLRRREESDGSVTYTLRVAPEDAALIDAAVAAGRAFVLDDEGNPTETPEEATMAMMVTGEPAITRADADVLVMIAESFLTSGAAAAPGDATLVLVHADLDALADGASISDEPATATAQAPPPGQPQPPPQQPAAPMDSDLSLDQRSWALRPPTTTTSNGTPLSRSTVLRMLCNSSAQLLIRARDGRPLDLGRTRRHASARQRRALAVRDGTCRFPGCTQRHRLIPHHSAWWSRGGATDLDLLVLLCPTHHRAVHELGYDVTALGGGRFRFRRPDGSVLRNFAGPLPDDAGPGDVLEDGPDDDVPSDAGEPEPVTPWTISPTWGGERLDLRMVVGGLADSLLVRSGLRPMDIPYAELDDTLRALAQWPPGSEPAQPHPPAAA